jgi:DNA polymerase II large subunit
MKNDYKVIESSVEIYYTNKKGKEYTVLVDIEDFERILEYKRSVYVCEYYTKNAKTPYANVRIYGPNGSRIQLSKFILGNCREGLEVDHINRQPLDNRKQNLRLVDHHTNCLNRNYNNKQSKSGIKGVHWCNTNKLWKVTRTIKGKHLSYGYFKTIEEAIPIAKEVYKDRPSN